MIYRILFNNSLKSTIYKEYQEAKKKAYFFRRFFKPVFIYHFVNEKEPEPVKKEEFDRLP